MGRPRREREPIIGFTTSHGLLLDLDGMPLSKVKALAKFYCNRFKLQGYLIARSSQGNFHVIFNRYLSWPTVMEYLFKIVWHYHYHDHASMPHLTNWAILQTIKKSETLRIGYKGKKKPPKILWKASDICPSYTDQRKTSLIRDYVNFKNQGKTPFIPSWVYTDLRMNGLTRDTLIRDYLHKQAAEVNNPRLKTSSQATSSKTHSS